MTPVGMIGADFGWKHSSQTKRAEAFIFPRVNWLAPARLSRLLIAAGLACIWRSTQGLRIIAESKLSFD
jgi:hypothetical protein